MSSRQQYQRDYYLLTLAIAGREPDRDPAPVREHIAACRAAGMTSAQIADAAGLHYKTVEYIARTSKRVRAATARAILGVRPGPSAIGAVRRIRALAALGWTSREIAQVAGLTVATVKHYRAGKVTYLEPATAQALDRAFRALAMRTPPQAPANRRTRTIATRRGWAPPLAWDSIDDPDATPDLGPDDADDTAIDHAAVARAIDRGGVQLTPAERLEVIRRMAADGHGDPEIAQHCGCTARTVERARRQHDIPSRWQRSVA